ncbi:MAG: hypothetical protein C0175_03745, partial [Caldisericum exile]
MTEWRSKKKNSGKVIHFPIHEGYTQKEREIIINKENKSDTIKKEYVKELEKEAREILKEM